MSSVLICGGAALSDVRPDEADESIAFELARGINHFDTSDDYGASETHLGRWMPRVRNEIFLATKTTERTRQRATQTIRRSLKRLKVDRVDLIQLHAICDLDELDEVTRTGGALEAAVEAREEGLAGGSESPATERTPPPPTSRPFAAFRSTRCLPHIASGSAETLCSAVTSMRSPRRLGSKTSGSCSSSTLPRTSGAILRSRATPTWYEPLDEQRHIDAAVAFVLRHPEATGNLHSGRHPPAPQGGGS